MESGKGSEIERTSETKIEEVFNIIKLYKVENSWDEKSELRLTEKKGVKSSARQKQLTKRDKKAIVCCFIF